MPREQSEIVKLVFFLKRKPGLTREAFVKQYEAGHARLGEKHVPNAIRYVRRYLEQVPELFTGDVREPEHDVVTELWFANKAEYETAMERLARPEVVAEIIADEETIFDRSRHRVFLVDEHVSDTGQRADE